MSVGSKRKVIIYSCPLQISIDNSQHYSLQISSGDKLDKGDLLAKIETDEASIISFETPDEGYLAKIIVPAGTKNVCIGKLICIIVSDEESIVAFKDFKDSLAPTQRVPVVPAPTIPSVPKRIVSFFIAAGAFIIFLFWTVIFAIQNMFKFLIPLKYKMKSITGEIILVTGGAGGIGRLMTLMLANLGAIVVIWDINKTGKHLKFDLKDQKLVEIFFFFFD